jgi:hypothetical protein
MAVIATIASVPTAAVQDGFPAAAAGAGGHDDNVLVAVSTQPCCAGGDMISFNPAVTEERI